MARDRYHCIGVFDHLRKCIQLQEHELLLPWLHLVDAPDSGVCENPPSAVSVIAAPVAWHRQ